MFKVLFAASTANTLASAACLTQVLHHVPDAPWKMFVAAVLFVAMPGLCWAATVTAGLETTEA